MNELVDLLLVDDEPRNLDALEAILSDQGYRLLRAEDADRALKLLLENDVAVIVLDIKMPRIDGIELAQIVKGTKRFRQIPILFLTAHLVDDQDVIAGYGAGAVDYLTKPFNPQILRRKVAVFAELFRKTRALADLNEKLEQRVQERTSELEKSESALRVAARQKDEFLATLAHELRNPLAPLRTGLDLLIQSELPSSPETGRTLGAMKRQLDHVVRLIDDLLDVSRINTGTIELKKEPTSLTRLVQTSAQSFQALFDQRGIQLAVAADARLEAVVDSTRILQILGNLLHNAAKFTPAGGKVSMSLRYAEGKALIQVTDTGVGIPADQLYQVFEMFSRVQSPSAPVERGAGIGLALARRLAQLHGGELTAESAGENLGTTFLLQIPARELAALEAPAPEPAVQKRAVSTRHLEILVVEDNEDVAEVLAIWLERFGHKVTIARTGTEGVKLVQALRPQLVLCDVGLPEMDGIEVCEQVRKLSLDYRPTMVALTGWGKEEDQRRTKQAGFDRHLVKPVELDTLAQVVSTVAEFGKLDA